MRLASYVVGGEPRAAVLAADQTLVQVSDLLAGGPSSMLELLDAGPAVWDRLRAAAASAQGGEPVAKVQLAAPIPRPRRNLHHQRVVDGHATRAGDVILTGTPEGVGFARKPPEFLSVGDVMEAEVEKIGVLRNTVARQMD